MKYINIQKNARQARLQTIKATHPLPPQVSSSKERMKTSKKKLQKLQMYAP